jgi:TfoX/Sxy family transcriptional regulator of competence genes
VVPVTTRRRFGGLGIYARGLFFFALAWIGRR